MSTTILLNGVQFTGTGVFEGFTYDRLVDWQGVPNVDLGFEKRPNAPGAFAAGQTFPEEAVISIEGQFFGADEAAGIAAREALAELYNDGFPMTMSVADALRTTSREVYVKAVKFPWTIHREFSFTIDVSAHDPRRYGEPVVVGTPLAIAGSGLDWSANGLDWSTEGLDWGTPSIDGRVVVTNTGNTQTVSTYLVSGGSMPDGFAIVNVDTGERLTYIGPVTEGTTVTLDTASLTAFINGVSPAGRFLPSPQWWSVPRKGALSLQFLALGTVFGSPRLDVTTAPAFY